MPFSTDAALHADVDFWGNAEAQEHDRNNVRALALVFADRRPLKLLRYLLGVAGIVSWPRIIFRECLRPRERTKR